MKLENELFKYNKSPLEEIHSDLLEEKEIRLFVKRDDLLFPRPSGNKFRKLKYNLHTARTEGYKTLLTFGGAFSNHLYATAEAGKRFGFDTIGLIRGERPVALNATLAHAEGCGMKLLFIDRATYRLKNELAFQNQLAQRFGRVYVLPEGGTNAFALQGCAEIAAEVRAQLGTTEIDYWLAACGTGGTFAGLVQGIKESAKGIGISVLKGDFMQGAVAALLAETNFKATRSWHIENRFHHGGYAKHTPELIAFINQFKTDFDIPLDPIYTGKLFFALWELIHQDYFPKGATICALHTGGLQGIAGFNQRFGGLIV